MILRKDLWGICRGRMMSGFKNGKRLEEDDVGALSGVALGENCGFADDVAAGFAGSQDFANIMAGYGL